MQKKEELKFMKKQLLVTAMLTMALAATACSKKSDPAETTVETTAETTAETTEAEDIDEDSMSGYITAVNGKILTVQNDEDNTVKDYDVTDAEIIQEYAFTEGDWVEIFFPAETTENPVPVLRVEVLESVIAQISADVDPSEEVTIKEVGTDTVTFTAEDGESYTVNTANAYIVGKMAADTKATITYIGDLDDSPLAVKIVTEDSYDTDDAEKSAFTGKIAKTDDESLVLISAHEDFYTFVSDEIDFSEYNVGDRVQVFYTGSIMEKEIPAVKVVKK